MRWSSSYNDINYVDPLNATTSDGNGVADMLREIVFGGGQEESQNLAAELMRDLIP